MHLMVVVRKQSRSERQPSKQADSLQGTAQQATCSFSPI